MNQGRGRLDNWNLEKKTGELKDDKHNVKNVGAVLNCVIINGRNVSVFHIDCFEQGKLY